MGASRRIYLNQLLADLLAQYDGVFLGENHANPSILQAVTILMPQLRDSGVRTISYEIAQPIIDAANDAETPADIVKHYPMMDTLKARVLFDLANSARRHGIHLIGHERGEFAMHQEESFQHRVSQGEQESVLKQAISLAGMHYRDSKAETYIRNKKFPGKILIIGGAFHSTKLVRGREDMIYEGLNVRLRYPSIDMFEPPMIHVSEIGLTKPDQNVNSDYIVGMPPWPHHLVSVLQNERQAVLGWTQPVAPAPVSTYEQWVTWPPAPLPSSEFLKSPATPAVPFNLFSKGGGAKR